MERYTLDQVRERMIHAWDGVTCVSATGSMKHFPVMRGDPDYPRFLDSTDLDLPIRQLSAWWMAPDRWRHDMRRGQDPALSYVGVANRWWLRHDGVLRRSGTTEEARQQGLTQEGNLIYGRPYLSPEQNAHLWLWLNPAIWVASYDLVMNNWFAPLPDDVYHDEEIVHVLASAGFESNPVTGEKKKLSDRWWIWDWDRDEELGDYVNFFQLWVDMRTGFCRRMTAEGANGRHWDILVQSLTLNDPVQVPHDMFEI